MALNPKVTDLGEDVELEWTPDPTGQGYRLYLNGEPVSRTFKPEASKTKFRKPDAESHRYGVRKMDVVGPLEEAVWPVPPTPEPVVGGLDLPAKFHIFGGNEGSKALVVDFLVSSFSTSFDPRVARQTNPKLICAAHPALDPFHSDWRLRRGTAWTYGSGLRGAPNGVQGGPAFGPWPGVNDQLSPNPQGTIRGYQIPGDDGCKQVIDGLQGFAIHKSATSAFLAQALYYAWKVGQFAERDFDGLWSDNFFTAGTGNLLTSNNVYGACGATISGAAWDAELVAILDYLRSKAGHILLGGNIAYRAVTPALRAGTTMALREDIQDLVNQGIEATWKDIQDSQAWAQVAGDRPKVFAVMDRVSASDQNRQRFGWALACMYADGGAYAAYDGNHANTYWPSGVTRGYLGKPTGPPVRSGNVITRPFGNREVRADFSTKTGTFS